MTQLLPYVRFNGKAKEAFDFYKSVLGGELTITKVGESSMAQFMSDKKDDVFHAELRSENIILLGSDMVGEEGLKQGNRMVLTLECSRKEEVETYFEKLSKDGIIGHAVADQEFGTIGDFQDKYGIDWFVISRKSK